MKQILSTCKGCSRHNWIVNRKYFLCYHCNRKRLLRDKPAKPKQPLRNSNKNAQGNTRFYNLVWNSKPHACEECDKPLISYSAHYISHIVPKGAHDPAREDLRNANILCAECHHRWEFGDRENMKIYPRNQEIREQLLNEYYQSKRA